MSRLIKGADKSVTPGDIAFLGMYDRPETRVANDVFWGNIRACLNHGPDRLNRETDPMACWLSPKLVLAQTCGYPFRAGLHDKVTLIGTPDYRLPGCAPGHYRSVFVARNDDAPDLSAYAGKTFAYNEALSQSGWAAPMLHMEHAGILPGQVLQSGGHLFSARAVAEGRADFAALDAVSWALMCRYDRFARNLQAIAVTKPTPGLPMISAKGSDAIALFEAVSQAINTLDPQHKKTLMLNGIVRIGARAYLQVKNPQHTPDDLPPAS